MTVPFVGPWILLAPPNTDPSYIARARKLVGELLYRAASGAGGVLRRTVWMPGGGTITATINGTLPVVQITLLGVVTPTQVTTGNMWIPRGFVLYPAWSNNPYGVGLPIVQNGGTPYDPVNTAPGLDEARWTGGGPLGEVLLSADVDAGYPLDTTIPVPLFYDVSFPPQYFGATTADAQALQSAWIGYRLELVPFTNVGNGADPVNQLAMFEGINLLRANAGVPAATLRLRGFARQGEITATVMNVAGADTPTNPAYPASYTDKAARTTTEGYSADWIDQSFPSFNRSDIYTTSEFMTVGSGTSAVATWAADGTLGPELVVDTPGLVCDTGFMNGFCAAYLAKHDRWIDAGNMSWQSSDPTIPPLSWFGPASLSLGWETFPVQVQYGNLTAPFSLLTNFTNSDGDMWITYPRSKTPTSQSAEPLMGRHIYARGRAIAMAPEGALVWGACVISNVQTTINGQSVVADRLVALTHHPVDQPNNLTGGFTRYVRVWWCDIPQRKLRVDPPLVIVGTDSGDNYAWQGGTRIDLGAMPAPSAGFVASTTPNSLKVASQWRFSQDGTRAVCLRDYSALTDYQYYFDNAPPAPEPWYAQANGAQQRAVELLFSPSGTSLGVVPVFHDYTAAWKQPSNILFPVLPGQPGPAFPLAVDYAPGSTALVYAYAGAGYDFGPGQNGVSFAGTGDASVVFTAQLNYRVTMGCQNVNLGIDFTPQVVMCVDVNNAAFLAHGTHAYYLNTTNPSTGLLNPNPNYVCWPFTSSLAHGVRTFMKGRLLNDTWFPVPDGALITQQPPCNGTMISFSAPLLMTDCVQPYFASRFGEYVFSYQVSPTPGATIMLDTVPDNTTPPGNNCGCQPSWNNVLQSGNTHYMGYSELHPRGGGTAASITLPDMGWTIYTKVV